jgi:bacterioferritin-associated ferredoxin
VLVICGSISDDQIEAISTKLPVDKADLKKFFPK